MTAFRFGWRPDRPDPKDHLFKLHMGDAPRAESATRMLGLSGAVRDQRNTGSCFPAGTLVLMGDHTERPIEEVAIGNEVITHTGKRRKVLRTQVRPYDSLMYALKLRGYGYPLTMTDEHPVACIRARDTAREDRPSDRADVEWVPARELKPRDWVLVPARTQPEEDAAPIRLDVERFIEGDCVAADGRVRIISARKSHTIASSVLLDERLSRLLGLFLAEGSYQKGYGRPSGLTFTFAREERTYQTFVVEAIREIFGADAKVEETDARPSISDVSCSNTTLAEFFYSLCGEGALRKCVPQPVFESCRNVRLALLRGWLEGDGTKGDARLKSTRGVTRGAVQIDGVTSSIEMARGLFRLSLLCGLKPGFTQRKQADHQSAPGNTLVFYSEDAFVLRPDAADRAAELGITPSPWKKYRKHEHGFLCRVDSIEITQPDEPLDVYNLEVEGEHTYIANSIAVHNCVGQACAEAIQVRRRLDGAPAHEELSALALYWHARALSGQEDEDEGTYIRNAMQVARKVGVCSEDSWPFDEAKVNQRPSMAAELEGLHRFEGSFERITETGPWRAERVLDALQSDCPVVFGTQVTSVFMAHRGDGVIAAPRPNDVRVGGHAVFALGFSDFGRRVRIKNSWSSSWADRGFAWIDPEWLALPETQDVIVLRPRPLQVAA